MTSSERTWLGVSSAMCACRLLACNIWKQYRIILRKYWANISRFHTYLVTIKPINTSPSQAYANALYSELSPIWTMMTGITVRGPLHNASWTDDQSLIRRPRRFRVKPSLTRDLIWTALVQQKLWLNRGQGQIWTWFKLDRRWWNAPLMGYNSNFHHWHYGSIFIRLAAVGYENREITRNSDKIWPYSSSRSSKVIDLGVNRKRICDFLLATNNNVGLISYRYRDIEA